MCCLCEKEKKICLQGSVKYRCVDRTVWNNNTMPLPVTPVLLECNNIIRQLNGTNNKKNKQLTLHLNFYTLGRSLFPRKARIISNSFYSI